MHLVRAAHAKVNLALAVGPPSPPDAATGAAGLHPIASWMHAIELSDTVRMEWLGEHHPPRFEVLWAADAPRQSPIDWPREKDLGVRALRLIEQAVGRTLPVDIRIEKRIPVGGGLGGGSSDAAAVMVGLRDLLSLRLTDAELVKLSARLGSDIGYFIDAAPPAPALVTGFGDAIKRLPRTNAGREIVLVCPVFGCATGAVYKAFDALGPPALRGAEVEAISAGGMDGLFNDLLPAAERVQPGLRPLREAVERAAGQPMHMSGSGSTLFVLPKAGGGLAAELAAKIAREVTDISVVVSRLV